MGSDAIASLPMPISKTKNEHFFKTWTPEMAYVLGFFAADGSMYKTKRGGHYIEFQITDGELLEQIKKILGSDHKIAVRNLNPRWQTIYRLQIGSKIMFEDLETLGFMQTKTHIMKFPNIPSDYMNHFVRGYFDGDGNVWRGIIHKFDRPHSSNALKTCFTSGSEQFLETLKEKLNDSAEMTGGSLCYSRAYRLQYASADSLKLYRFMYYDSGVLCLPRKREVFEKFIDSAVVA